MGSPTGAPRSNSIEQAELPARWVSVSIIMKPCQAVYCSIGGSSGGSYVVICYSLGPGGEETRGGSRAEKEEEIFCKRNSASSVTQERDKKPRVEHALKV